MNEQQKEQLIERILRGRNPVCLHAAGQPLVNVLCTIIREQSTSLGEQIKHMYPLQGNEQFYKDISTTFIESGPTWGLTSKYNVEEATCEMQEDGDGLLGTILHVSPAAAFNGVMLILQAKNLVGFIQKELLQAVVEQDAGQIDANMACTIMQFAFFGKEVYC